MSGSAKKRREKERQRERPYANRHKWDALSNALAEQLKERVDRKHIDDMVNKPWIIDEASDINPAVFDALPRDFPGSFIAMRTPRRDAP